MTQQPDKPPVKKPEPSRTDEAREVAKDYADDQREIAKKLRNKLN